MEPVFGPLRIGSISYASRRRVWFSDVDQLVLPEDYEELSDRDRAVWFLEHSGLYQGETVVECLQPYSAQPETWQIRMEEGTAYELTLDNEAEGVADILGPYPDWNIAH